VAVTGSTKEGVTIEQTRSIQRRKMPDADRAEQRELLGVEERASEVGEWPLTGPENPEDVKPTAAELRSLTPSDDQIRAITAGEDDE
jgi:hypothetical protein